MFGQLLFFSPILMKIPVNVNGARSSLSRRDTDLFSENETTSSLNLVAALHTHNNEALSIKKKGSMSNIVGNQIVHPTILVKIFYKSTG